MKSLSEFLAMGGYAFFVWTSYGITAVVLVANLIFPVFQRRKLMTELARKARRSRKPT